MKNEFLGETIKRFADAGIFACDYSNASYANFVVYADGDDLEEEFTINSWACWIQQKENDWIVYPPPHLTGSPLINRQLPTLDLAIRLTIYLHEHRNDVKLNNTRDSIEHTLNLLESWQNSLIVE